MDPSLQLMLSSSNKEKQARKGGRKQMCMQPEVQRQEQFPMDRLKCHSLRNAAVQACAIAILPATSDTKQGKIYSKAHISIVNWRLHAC